VAVNGVKAKLQAIASTGEIRLDGIPCPGATLGNTDTIQVVGGALADVFTLTGAFAPGLTPEADGSSEIEVSFDLGGGSDDVTINLRNGDDTIAFTSAGIDVGGDLDEDLVTAGIEALRVDGRGGSDVIDASAYTGTPSNAVLELRGGAGDDRLTGSLGKDYFYGEDGDDILYGGAGNDRFFGGSGMDDMYGQGGDDRMYEEAVANGSDLFSGGAGNDWVFYNPRSNPIYVDLSNDLADEGEAGENDSILPSIEEVHGGQADDVLVGSGAVNRLAGMGGNDEIHGNGGDDALFGGDGDDILIGNTGHDFITGDAGNDFIDGGTGGATMYGMDGNDTLTAAGDVGIYYIGGAGDDVMYNANGVKDFIDCGDGFDDPEPDPLDYFFPSCEAI
jgi:Ca2+-binding RTX toxin-like protein